MHGKRSKNKRECRVFLIEHHELMDIAFGKPKNATFYLSVASFALRGSSADLGGSGVLWYSLKWSLGVVDSSSVRTDIIYDFVYNICFFKFGEV